MAEETKGSRIAKRYGFELISHFFNLIYVLDNWDRLKRISAIYDYHEKTFLETFRKHDENTGMVNILDHYMHIIKNHDEFEIIVYNIDSVRNHKTKRFLRSFLLSVFTFKRGKVYLRESSIVLKSFLLDSFMFKRAKVYLRESSIKSSRKPHELHFKVRKVNLIRVRSLFDGSIISYYPKKGLNGNPIILGKGVDNSLYVITEINGKRVSYYTRRMRKMPKINRIALKNRKIQYQFFKMLLGKGILTRPVKIISTIPGSFRLSKTPSWAFSPVYFFNNNLVRSFIDPSILNPVLIDYDYDETNQVLLKFIDETYHSLLCGLDYRNSLWCITLPPITMWWRIKNVYKYVYNLEDDMKVFNY